VEAGWISGGARYARCTPVRQIDPKHWDRHAAGAVIPASIVGTCLRASNCLPHSRYTVYIHVLLQVYLNDVAKLRLLST